MRPADGPTRPVAGLGIAIVNYRNANDTAELVRSLAATNDSVANHGATNHSATAPVAVAVVDNSDQVAELEAVVRFAREHGMHAQLIHGHGNVGYAAGNNLAARFLMQARCADVAVDPEPRHPPRRRRGHRDAGPRGRRRRAIAAPLRSPGPSRSAPPRLRNAIHLWTGQSGQLPPRPSPGTRKLTYVAGHSLAMTRAAWAGLGGLSDDFFLFLRGGRPGGPLRPPRHPRHRRSPTPTVRHAGGGSTGATTDLTRKSVTRLLPRQPQLA